MIKKMLLSVVLMVAATSAHAVMDVQDIVNSSWTVITKSVSTGTLAVEMDTDTIKLANRKGIEIQNIHASANLWCGHKKDTVSITTGHKITAGNTWYVGLTSYDIPISTGNGAPAPAPSKLSIFCLSDNATPTDAVITQVRGK